VNKWFSANPVLGTGDLPGIFLLAIHAAGHRIMLSSGLFILRKGYAGSCAAFVIAQGNRPIESVTRLRQDVAFVRAALYGGQPQLLPLHGRNNCPDAQSSGSQRYAKVSGGSSREPMAHHSRPIGSKRGNCQPCGTHSFDHAGSPGTYSLRLVVNPPRV